MWHVDLGILIEGLDSEWTRTDENIARLVDREDYWLRAEYSQWITDPSDPEIKRQQLERKRRGIKPPPEPNIFPAATRPQLIHDYLVDLAMEKTKQHAGLGAPQKISIAEFRRMRGKQ